MKLRGILNVTVIIGLGFLVIDGFADNGSPHRHSTEFSSVIEQYFQRDGGAVKDLPSGRPSPGYGYRGTIYVRKQEDSNRHVLYEVLLNECDGGPRLIGPIESPDANLILFSVVDLEGGYLVLIHRNTFVLDELHMPTGLGAQCPLWFPDSHRICVFGRSPMSEGAWVYDTTSRKADRVDRLWDIVPRRTYWGKEPGRDLMLEQETSNDNWMSTMIVLWHYDFKTDKLEKVQETLEKPAKKKT
jgi:hypothetical protein